MRVCLLSMTAIADDPRVRRQGDALADAGIDVSGIGLPGATSPHPAWPIDEVPLPAPAVRRLATATTLGVGRLVPAAATRAFALDPRHAAMRRLAELRNPDLVIANDWRVLPVAAPLRARHGVPFLYDSHEMAIDEVTDSRWWKAVVRPVVRRVEGNAIRDAAAVTTVSQGIAEALREEYGLGNQPTVIRNVPTFEPYDVRPAGDTITVLYHGYFVGDRALEELVISVTQWRAGLQLILRGVGAPTYEARLRQVARERGVDDRVTFEPPVPMTELIRHAHEADVGIFVTGGTGRQHEYVLPNKLFEYVMAGLAVCVSDTAEMGSIVRRYDIGEVVAGPDPREIARAVNAFTADTVNRYKRNAVRAARDLCWEREAPRLLDIVRAAARDA